MDLLPGEELTIGEAAALWGVTREHFHFLIKRGAIPRRLIMRRPTANGYRPVIIRSQLLDFKCRIMARKFTFQKKDKQ